ncbi:protein translocase subunit SecF [Candidatus Nomurabacteria bacterium]|nr:protein translocase subunit SecF [Candidatus Kaiserbacteria bacterium]MCB9814316.1 protein translocase subunit SecF [Candidatus Nomurabacteria bacterium]
MFAITYRKIFLLIAAFIMVGSVVIVGVLGLKLGIDFTGGSLTEVSYQVAPEKDQVESAVAEQNFDGSSSVRASEDEAGRSAYLIRTQDLTEEQHDALTKSLTSLGEGGEITRFTSIGPVIGQELKDKAVWAIFGVVSVIILYVAFAFSGIGTPVSSWTYGGITIFVLIHDVLVPTALISTLGHFAGVEVDVLFVMAILAVLGYSVNDTIVVFDRVRENLILNRTEKRTKKVEAGVTHETVVYNLTKPYEEIVGSAVSETMSRSINTSMTTLIALLALYIFGGAATQIFALVMIAGVVAGTYSSICIASPLVVAYAKWQDEKKAVAK